VTTITDDPVVEADIDLEAVIYAPTPPCDRGATRFLYRSGSFVHVLRLQTELPDLPLSARLLRSAPRAIPTAPETHLYHGRFPATSKQRDARASSSAG
jgi:hypothetical protein